ncbi:ketopantoate reductase family protein, partial [bacterium]|nr:ketopantoate reductase family protein [bacterium]
MNSGEKLAIIGAGAIGSLVGGMLARAGKDVTLIGRKEHMEAVNKNGLSINGVVGEFNVQIKTAEKLDFKPDIVFLAGKTQDVEESCLEIKPLIGDIPIVLMQNGVRSADIAASILGEKNIISCILLLNAQFLEPGIVTCINQKPSIIGEMFDKNGERIKQIQALLNHVSETIISDNIRGAQWTKLFINAMGNSIDAMTGLTLGEYVKYYNIRKIAVQILKEALKVVETATIKLEKLPGIPISAFKTIIKMPTPLAAFILKYAMSSKGNSDIVTSTLQSIRKGKKTEIDYINGEFVKLGMRIGVQTPYNSKVVELIHTIEDS